jgi:cytidyltransferase-like protein
MEMAKYSLFIGRYQPLHEGHIKLIRTVLDEGKNVLVALRDVEDKTNDPYSVAERMVMFEKEFPEEIASKQMVVIGTPDIEEVCYGRKVGWGMREIVLDAETQAISATKIREERGL